VIDLDTSVLSEFMRREPPDAVVTWVDEQPADEAWLTVVTLAELLYE
jgi:predicted nucleic acid-binding protein